MPAPVFQLSTLYLVTLSLGIVVGIWLYSALIEHLREQHPEEYRAIGSPELVMASPRRGIALQRFIYGPGLRHTDPVLRRWCRRAALFAVVLVGALVLEMGAFALALVAQL